MTPDRIDDVLLLTIQAYLEGEMTFEELSEHYDRVYLPELRSSFRSDESRQLFGLIRQQISFVTEEIASYGRRGRLEAGFHDWLRDAAQVLELMTRGSR
jgi:hypothetical protein